MNSSTTSCVRHLPDIRFFIKFEDILRLICNGDHAKCAAHRVLEVKTNNKLTVLRESGHEGKIPEKLLWFTMHWDDFVFWSLGDREKTSFRRVLPEIVSDGYARARYVKEDECGRLMCDARGKPFIYPTYKEAQADHAVDGLIVIQYLYLYRKVNARLDAALPGGDDGNGGGNHEEEGAAGDAATEGVTSESAAPSQVGGTRGGNLHHAPTATANDTTLPLPKTTGGTPDSDESAEGCSNRQDPPCLNEQEPPVQNGNKKNLLIESTTQESTKTTAAPGSGAVVSSSDFFEKAETTSLPPEDIWSEEAILALAGQYLAPLPTYINARQRQDNEEKWHDAAHALYESSYFRLLGPDYAILELDDILNFVTHPQSPAWWVQAAPFDVRLWHVANNIVKMAQDMHAAGWIRESYEIRRPGEEVEQFIEEPRIHEEAERPGLRDTAPLVRDVSAPAAPPISPEPAAMSEEEATTLLASIRVTHTQFYPRCVRLGGRSDYRVDISTSPGRTVALYSEEAWRDLRAEWSRAPRPSERFAQLLAGRRKAG